MTYRERVDQTISDGHSLKVDGDLGLGVLCVDLIADCWYVLPCIRLEVGRKVEENVLG